MTADLLREAAAKMREAANAATAGPWAYWRMEERLEVFVPNGTMSTETVLEFKDELDCEECVRPSDADTHHIASWHPAVALAVADWLDSWAVGLGRGVAVENAVHAVAVARVYLGRDA